MIAVQRPTGETRGLVRTVIPAAHLAVLCLGPGTSITRPALTTLYRAGDVGRVHRSRRHRRLHHRSASRDGRPVAAAHARLFADPDARRAGARLLYQARYPNDPLPDGAPPPSLRGMAGSRVKSTYKLYDARHRHKNFRRVTEGATDPVNVALNHANSLLYCLALTSPEPLDSPALGVIRQGTTAAFLYDLADVYKTAVSIPAAFQAADDARTLASNGRHVRRRLHEHKVLPSMLTLTQRLLTGSFDTADGSDLLLDDTASSPATSTGPRVNFVVIQVETVPDHLRGYLERFLHRS